jgi:DNA-binding transcriptional regulator/RsmH inhibitor MraZ
LIPPSLRPAVGLESNVTVIGAGEFLEIWSPDRYIEEMTEVDERLESTLELLEPKS